jgi:predicted enzyme related to lactoylglutathione lyase
MVAPQDFPGGRSAILADPQGAVFALQMVTR